MQLKFFNPIYISGLVFLGLSIVISIIMICVSFKKDNKNSAGFYTLTLEFAKFVKESIEKKGYVCPQNVFNDSVNGDCTKCPYYKTKCVVYKKN